MVGCVAARFGPSFWAVRDQPYEDTLQAYYAHLEMARIEGLERGQEQLREASLTNKAVNAPKGLARDVRDHEHRLRRGPRARRITLDDFMDFPLVAQLRRPKVS